MSGLDGAEGSDDVVECCLFSFLAGILRACSFWFEADEDTRQVLAVVCFVLAALLTASAFSRAQVSVVTAHNDIARTGQNLNETILTPSNVNGTQFGKLFSQGIDAFGQAQPLYVPGVAIPGKGTHNVVYVGTARDTMYAFDADSNGGSNAAPLWQISFLSTLPKGGKTNGGVIGTPVIDLSSETMYVVSSDYSGGVYINRIHGLDITTGAEKFGGPVQLEASIAGTGSGSSGVS